MILGNPRADGAQDLLTLPPQEFSRRLDRIYDTEGADAADAFLAQYSRARDATCGGCAPTTAPDAEIEKMLAEIGDDPAAEPSTSSIETPVNTDMAAAINAEIAATLPTTALPAPDVEVIANVTDDEVTRAVEAVESRVDAHHKVPPSLRAKLRQIGEDFERRQADFSREQKKFDDRLDAPKIKRGRELARLRKQRERLKKAKPAIGAKPKRRPLPMRHPGYEPLHWKRMLEILTKWVELGTGKRAEQLRREDDGYRRRLVKFVEFHTLHVDRWGKTPSDASIAKQLRCSEAQARRAYEISMALFGVSGPWHEYRAA